MQVIVAGHEALGKSYVRRYTQAYTHTHAHTHKTHTFLMHA